MRRSLGCTRHALKDRRGKGKGRAFCVDSIGDSIKVGMPPIARPDARLFILGSLPGDASLSAQRYYAHPTNQFWRLLGQAIGEELQPLAYDERLQRLAERHIGLWDVIASASRRGSLDQSIRSAAHNRLEQLRHDFPELRALAFNGSTAAAAGRRLLGAGEGLTLIELPSSSAANTRPFAQKAEAWSVLAQFVGA
jgi:hypoxanthine-DNA glycosylase